METRPNEFRTFITTILEYAPEDYEPWLFRCQKGGKAPALEFGSWKDKKNKLSPREAVCWMEKGGNIGIAGMPDDPLINVDIDDEETTKKDDLKPTLMARSRSRTGLHAWYFTKDNIPNIPTDNAGEIRAQGQYVIAPGSYVKTNPDEVPEEETENAGYYTIEERRPVEWIKFDELPKVFIEQKKKQEQKIQKKPSEFNPRKKTGSHSAVYDIDARDIVFKEGGSTNPTDRWTAIFHDSETGMNMSLSDQGLLHCWRHNVSHNGLQALVVLSGYMTCQEAGSPHSNSGAGYSGIVGDDGAIYHAWKYAKEHGYIPKDDPVPVRAMRYIAKQNKLTMESTNRMLPKPTYCKVLDIIDAEVKV
jgi:putative DNA primase/helicase